MGQTGRLLAGLAFVALSGCSLAGGDAVTHSLSHPGQSHSVFGLTVSLMPRPFSPGESADDAVRRLEAAGYAADPSQTFSLRAPQAVPADGKHFYKSVTRFPCTTRYEVVLRIDAFDRLTDAYGTSDPLACT